MEKLSNEMLALKLDDEVQELAETDDANLKYIKLKEKYCKLQEYYKTKVSKLEIHLA